MRDDRSSRQARSVIPGQLWLAEHPPATATLCPVDQSAVESASVVIYQRSLAGLIAQAMPVGAYAEPLSWDTQVSDLVISPRAFRFANDGWGVVQLIEAFPSFRQRRERVEKALTQFTRANPGGGLFARVIAKAAADSYQEFDTTLDILPDIVDDIGRKCLLTIVFGKLGLLPAAYLPVFTSNGLAG